MTRLTQERLGHTYGWTPPPPDSNGNSTCKQLISGSPVNDCNSERLTWTAKANADYLLEFWLRSNASTFGSAAPTQFYLNIATDGEAPQVTRLWNDLRSQGNKFLPTTSTWTKYSVYFSNIEASGSANELPESVRIQVGSRPKLNPSLTSAVESWQRSRQLLHR